ncbi:MAG: hypothetical protein GY740_05985 [Gammaproteobacteria bacterium]|nr:hypothetical protein [Gammaproteobacteria bacterium]
MVLDYAFVPPSGKAKKSPNKKAGETSAAKKLTAVRADTGDKGGQREEDEREEDEWGVDAARSLKPLDVASWSRMVSYMVNILREREQLESSLNFSLDELPESVNVFKGVNIADISRRYQLRSSCSFVGE